MGSLEEDWEAGDSSDTPVFSFPVKYKFVIVSGRINQLLRKQLPVDDEAFFCCTTDDDFGETGVFLSRDADDVP